MANQRYSPEFKDEAVRQVVDRGYSVAEVAARLGVSSHIGTKRTPGSAQLKSLAGCTPSEYLRNHRLQEALPYLRHGEPIGETANKVGFASQSYLPVVSKPATT
jgi:AraC-like DNA-binding protein